MNTSIKLRLSRSGAIRNLQICALSAALTAGFCGAAYAETSQAEAKLAIVRAQADVDLISKESPAATGDRSFMTAQTKLTDARNAVAKDKNREAMWLANEAELLADTTVATVKLSDMEHTRGEIAHDVEVLASELNKSEQNK